MGKKDIVMTETRDIRGHGLKTKGTEWPGCPGDLAQQLCSQGFAKEINPSRARETSGQYRGDDPTTKEKDEAWVGGKSPRKKESRK